VFVTGYMFVTLVTLVTLFSSKKYFLSLPVENIIDPLLLRLTVWDLSHRVIPYGMRILKDRGPRCKKQKRGKNDGLLR